MKEFIEFLENHKIISQLKKQYLKDSNSDENFRFFNNFKKLLSQSSKKRNTNLDGLAYLYEQEVSYHQRKKLGEIYTPRAIVDQILDGVGFYNENSIGSKTIIDISCGAGSFLVQAVKRIINYKRDSSEDLDITGLKSIVQLIKSKIIGIDINPIACILCQINILYELFEIIDSILKEDPSFPIPVFQIENNNIFSHIFNQKYDFIVGNPPYLFIREIPQDQKELIESRKFETCQGQYDYYQLFIEIGIKLLKSDGKLGFIVPDSILALSNRHIIRKYIYDHTIIREISYIGPQFNDPIVSNIILVLQREADCNKIAKNMVNLNLKQNSELISSSILQQHFEDWDYKFLINLNQEDIKILNFLNKNFSKLRHIMEQSKYDIILTRGVELTKEGKIIFCPVCNKFYPLPTGKLICKTCKQELSTHSIETIIVDQKPKNPNDDYAPFIYSINRYQINETKYILLKKQGINYKSPGIYKNRILVRQLTQNNLICATFSRNGYTSQSIYNLGVLKSPVPEFNNLYLLGLMNSELISFYFIKSFGSYKNLYPRILIEKIKELPIKIPQTEYEKKEAKKIAEYVTKVLNVVESNPTLNNQYQIKINQLVYDIYNVRNEERHYIKNFLEKV